MARTDDVKRSDRFGVRNDGWKTREQAQSVNDLQNPWMRKAPTLARFDPAKSDQVERRVKPRPLLGFRLVECTSRGQHLECAPSTHRRDASRKTGIMRA
jgi:hypothetical protein